MSQLTYIVECKTVQPYFEPFAAFATELSALSYVLDCELTNPGFQYRVTENGAVIYPEEA